MSKLADITQPLASVFCQALFRQFPLEQAALTRVGIGYYDDTFWCCYQCGEPRTDLPDPLAVRDAALTALLEHLFEESCIEDYEHMQAAVRVWLLAQSIPVLQAKLADSGVNVARDIRVHVFVDELGTRDADRPLKLKLPKPSSRVDEHLAFVAVELDVNPTSLWDTYNALRMKAGISSDELRRRIAAGPS
ncbi:hypothetical protein ACFL6C_08205 [Myxococcota bacterium]